MQQEDITFFAGVPTMWWGLLGALTDDVDVDRIAAQPADRRLRRRQPPGGDHQAGQGALPRADPRGLRPLGDLAGRDVQRPRPRPAARLDRRPGLGDPVQADRRRVERDHRGRRGRRDRDQGPQHHEGLLQPARGDRRGDEGRVVPLRRPRPPRRGRLLLHRRPVQGHDHPRRLQRVPARDRGGPDDPRGGLAGRRHRRTPREPRRGDQGRRDPRRGRRRSPRTSWSPGPRSRWRPTSTRGSWSSSTTSR